MKSIQFIVLLSALCGTSCERNQVGTSEPSPRVLQLETEVERLKARETAATGVLEETQGELRRLKTQLSRNELTRESASAALDSVIAAERISKVSFSPNGLQLATKEGIIRFKERNNFGAFYEFTEKGFGIFGPLINKSQVVLDLYAYITPQDAGMDPSFSVKKPFSETLGEITGIAPTPYPGLSKVEFYALYDFPPEIKAYRRYFYSARRGDRIFQKYDDGWRLKD